MDAQGASPHVLLVAESPALSELAKDVLESASYRVTQQPTPVDARTWLRIHRADLAIVEVPEPEHALPALELLSFIKGRGGANALRTLVLPRATGDARFKDLFQTQRLTNFLAVGDDERLDPVELCVTVNKILSGDIFGVERYLAPGATLKTLTIRDSRKKDELVDQVEAFAREVGCHERVAQAFAVAADELVSNAIYNAPVDKDGKPRFQNRARTEAVVLEPSEEVTVTLGFDGRRLCVGARDPFGSLPAAKVIDYLAKCFARGEEQIDAKEGGAGLGLYSIFKLVQHFVLNLAPGKRTEAIGLLEVTRSFKSYAGRSRSFNVFLSESA